MDETQADSLEDNLTTTSVLSDAPSFRHVLAAPWMIMRPQRAAVQMTDGTRWAFWLSFVAGILVLALLVVVLVMWDETVGYSWSEQYSRQHFQRSFGAVWQDWHADGYFGHAEQLFLLVGILTPIATAVGAWLFLPNVHRGGRGWQSYKRVYRAVASGVGLLITFTFIIGAPMVVAINIEERGDYVEPTLVMLFVIFCLGCACVLVYWLIQATHAVAGADVPIELPPRCEGCGYDLTHRPSDERCPECGLDTSQSLEPDLCRPGCKWQACEDFVSWLSTTIAVIVSPTRFFRALKLRVLTQPADRFAQWNYLAIGVYTVCVCFVIFLIMFARFGDSPDSVVCFLPAVFFFLVPLICWTVHRIVGATVTSWFIVRQLLPDGRWAKTVMAYETAYLWVFCVYTSLLFLSFVLFEDWMSTIARVWSYRGLMPIELIVLPVSNMLLGLLWFWRYGIAYRNIRWSNY
ncbi:MAG: hydrogenase maturation nickel metallochaperone HypA [Phycisphaerales bacterium]|nr:hydrogenase maturation nickel metallochaperone HypA [Phycisphaerales bacterium]